MRTSTATPRYSGRNWTGCCTISLWSIVNELIDQQLNDYPDADIQATQDKLNTAYDAFSAKYGLLNDRKNGRLFEQDSSYYAINRTIRSICADYNKEEESKAKEENRDPVLLPKFSCHILRHTFCTRFCENETNLKVIQEIMGHADISTTMDVYAEATQEKKKESIASTLDGSITSSELSKYSAIKRVTAIVVATSP